ncbi:fasciclin domain-containing protein [Bermanella sp. WJH001]|uniref:fasciclin domain-containing protein n=1 Tax=Bermanella sp. WJH001 TaxID=3048005 RepID=UPI0024BECC81|nr:fasciclin domain-containing protein [Bermanella sp. WJH001]MDJ1537496.1 fasciclin domain-containing protein [Bermanella sp. WJH001]
MKTKILSLALLGAIGLTGCGSSDDDGPTLDIVETAQADDRFENLVTAVTTADLVSTLQSEGPFTVFAPTDDAFANYLDENNLTATELLASDSLADILTYHVYVGEVLASSAISVAGSSENQIEMVNGDNLALSLTGNDLYANLSKVVVTDVTATNGVIHAIDKVLTPPSANALSDTDKTIAALVTDLAGAAEPEFTVLLEALSTADLATALAGDGPFTVFAPTDAAFTALLEQLDIEKSDLLARDDLADILKQHVVSGVAIDSVAAFAANGSDVQTLNSAQKISVAISGGELTVDGSTVVITDVQTSNGVIHVIDTVITQNDAQ